MKKPMTKIKLIKNGFLFQNREAIQVTLILILALLVRLLGFVSRPIWYDEAFAILFSEKGPAAMLAGTLTLDSTGAAADIHPLAYYTILWAWMKVFGESLAGVRILSILFGLLTVLIVYAFMRVMFRQRSLALIGMLGVAVSPFQVHYSQEIRMYSMLTFLLVGATYTLWKALHTSQRRWWVFFSICAALAQYTHNLAVFFLFSLALTPILLHRWDKVKATILASVGAALLYIPWMLQLPGQLTKISNAYWVEKPNVDSLFRTLLSFTTNLPIAESWLPVALSATLLVTGLAAYQTFLALRRKQPEAFKGVWLAYLAFMPGILMFITSQYWPIYIERALLPSGIMFFLWIFWALKITGIPRMIHTVGITLLTVGIVLGLITHVTYNGFPYGPYADLVASLESRLLAGDTIIHSNKLTMLPALYFDRTMEARFIADPPGSSVDTLASATQQMLGLQASSSIDSSVGDAQRVWFIIFQKSIDESAASGLVTHPHITWLDENLHFEDSETWGPILIYLYSR